MAEQEKMTWDQANALEAWQACDRLEAENEWLRGALWALNDWLAETGYGERMPEKLRRQCGEAVAVSRTEISAVEGGEEEGTES